MSVTVSMDCFLHTLAEMRERQTTILRGGDEAEDQGEDIMTNDQGLAPFKAILHDPSNKPDMRIMAALRLMKILTDRGNLADAGGIANSAVNLVPEVCSWMLNNEDQARAIQIVSDFAVEACSIFLQLHDVERALLHIEFGRGLILDRFANLDPEITNLSQKIHSLTQLCKQVPPWAEEIASLDEKRLDLEALEWNEKRNAKFSGEGNLALRILMDEFKEAACDGFIVVVNVSRTRADAIIVSRAKVRSVELPRMMISMNPGPTDKKLLEPFYNTRNIGPECCPRPDEHFLDWLWFTCVRPILEDILPDFNVRREPGDLPRIWWIGTGAARSLPFHAATCFDQDSPIGTIDFILSSNAATIRALRRARSQEAERKRRVHDEPLYLTVATMPSTPGGTSLSGVTQERNAIRQAVRGIYTMKELQNPNVNDVLREIEKSTISHIACHGICHPSDPTQSHLLLQKSALSGPCLDRLTVRSVLHMKTGPTAWIAYLSACLTAQTKASSFSDGSLHLASAFQAAGYPHVIGTVARVDDNISVEVAQHFYEFLHNLGARARDSDRVVAEALRSAVLKVRQCYARDLYLWTPYVHFGV